MNSQQRIARKVAKRRATSKRHKSMNGFAEVEHKQAMQRKRTHTKHTTSTT